MLEAALSLPTHEFLSAVRDTTGDDGGAHAAEPAEAATAEAVWPLCSRSAFLRPC